MSEIAKKARAAMKAKATKLADRPVEKVDSSDWTPPPLLKADVKTGMRPVSRRAFKKGGKVIGKVEGQAAKVRADRKQRKAGGATEQPIVDRYINRDLKKANEYRDGEKHIGGFKKGGRTKKEGGGGIDLESLAGLRPVWKTKPAISQASALVDKLMKKGGRVKKANGGNADSDDIAKIIRQSEIEEGMKGRGLPEKVPTPTPRPKSTPKPFKDPIPPSQSPTFKKGGRAKKMDGGAMDPRLGLVKNKAFEFGNNVVTPGLKKGGKVHKADGGGAGDGKRTDKLQNVYQPDYNEEAVDKAIRTSKQKIGSSEGRKIKSLLGGWQERVKKYGRAEGGSAGHPDVAADKALIKKMVKEKALKDGKCYGGRTKKYSGGGVFSGEGYPGKVPGVTGGRKARKSGGKSDRGGEPERPWESGKAYYDLLTGWHNLDKATPDEIAHMRPEDAKAARAAQQSGSSSSASKAAPKAKQGSSGGRGRGRPSSPEGDYHDRPALTGDHMYYHDRPAYTGDHNASYERSELPDTASRLWTRSAKYLSPPNQFPRVGGPNTPPLLGGPNTPPQIGGGSPASPPPAEPQLGGPKSNLPAVSEGYKLPSVNEMGENAVKGALLRYGSKLIPGLGTAMEVLRSTPANAGEIDYMKRNAQMMRDDGHGSGGYKRGGRTKGKGKSNIHITINAGRHGQDQDQMGQGMPMPPMPPAPPMGMPPVPPMPPMGAGGPPMGGGMPPMPPAGGMNTGGRVGKAFGGSFGGGKGGMGGGQPMGGGRVPVRRDFNPMGGGSYGGQIGANPALGGGGMGRGVALGQLPLPPNGGFGPMTSVNTSLYGGPDPFVGGGVGAGPDPFVGGGLTPVRDYAAPYGNPALIARKSGGRVTKVAKSYKDMEAGAGSGEGRLQKTDIAKARAYRKDGGKVGHRSYKTYKDMDAGAGSGFGRLEKSEIQSRKK